MNARGLATLVTIAIAASGAGLTGSAASGKYTYKDRMEMGNLHFFNGNIDRAISAFEAATQLNPSSLEPRISLVNLYIQKGGEESLKRAASQCAEILKQKPNNKEVHLILGNLLRNEAASETDTEKQKAKLTEAATHVHAARELGAPQAVCLHTIATIHLQKGEIDEALKHSELALKEQSNFADAHLLHAVLMFKKLKTPLDPQAAETKAQLDKVIEELNLAIKQKGKNAEARNTKAEIEFVSGNYEQALDDYKKATEDDARYVAAWIGLGTCHAQIGAKAASTQVQQEHFQKAREAFEEAKHIKPDDKNIVYGLAAMLEKLGLYQDAIAEFHNELRLENDATTRASITLHLQQLQSLSVSQLQSIDGKTPSIGTAGTGTNLFTSGSLSFPFKDLIKIEDPTKRK